MDLHLAVSSSGDISASLYRQLLAAIRDGRLVSGERLPSTRELAYSLNLSRGTVTSAYDRLCAEGILESRPGSGTYVPAHVTPSRARCAPSGQRVAPRRVWSELPPSVPDPVGVDINLAGGEPDPSLFPLATWRRLVSETLRPSLMATSPYASTTHAALQDAIAGYLGRSRSVVAHGDDIILTNGSQQAFDLVTRVLVAPGDRVAVESPGYTSLVRLWSSHGARVTGVPVDDEGLVVAALPDDARVVYVTPSHQFPTGVVMSLPRRIALLEWAAARGAVIVEDDYDSEFRYQDRPLEPLQSLDWDGYVVYTGSFSKILSPVLRVGYLVAPVSLQSALRRAKQLTDWQGDLTTQGALARFIADGDLAAQLRRTTKTYAERRTTLLAALADIRELEVVPSIAGLRLATRFRDPSVDDVAVCAAAASRGVGVEPLSLRYVDGAEVRPSPGLVLGFGRIDAQQIPIAVSRLAAAIR
jgi:GntR family transcriptional regulator/MocR family aminotransferase